MMDDCKVGKNYLTPAFNVNSYINLVTDQTFDIWLIEFIETAGFVHTLLRWIFTSWKVNRGPPILHEKKINNKKLKAVLIYFIIIK